MNDKRTTHTPGQPIMMNRNAASNEARTNLIERDEWEALVSSFSPRARGDAANMAAHNYDVAMVGDRILISTPYGAAVWVDKDGNRTEVPKDDYDRLYDIIEDQTHPDWSSYNVTMQSGPFRRYRHFKLDALAEIAAEGTQS